MRGKIFDGRYVLGESLGSGGMGEVYLAHDGVLERDVALKVLRTQYAGDEEFAERFKWEARSAASLSHPNIVQVYDRGETEDGTSYIAMEYVPGGTLKEQITRRAPFGDSDAAAVGAQIADALEAAHEQGMIHRDIKPQNVLVTASGDLKVTDFGIARAASAMTNTASGAIFGTAAYISPEQALGEPVGPASDLYSLGVILYEMLTGELPFSADNSIAVCMKHVNEPPVPPQVVNPEISDGMSALVLMLLAKHPGDRYGSAMRLLSDLERVRDGLLPALALQTVTQPIGRLPHAAPLRRVDVSRRPRTARTLALASVATAALLGTLLFGLSQEGSGTGTLPRAQGFASEILDPPARAAVNTTNTTNTTNATKTPKTDANTGENPAPVIRSSASPTPSPSPPPVASPERTPAVPVGPPEDQAPSESQYDGGN
ncbi:MAG TPA: protein kinase [Rubrobacter sp.]|nr:protein kinase [Rubrobacter sp.]